MSAEPLTSAARSAPSASALQALARIAGEGELRAHAVRLLERARAALEISGWLLLQELRVDGEQIRHAVIGPGGVVVVVPGGVDPEFRHLAEAGGQARALARLLRLERHDVLAVVVTMDSAAAPTKHFYAEDSGIVVGDRQLHDWLCDLPVVLDPDTLVTLRDSIYMCADRAAKAKPPSLPTEPRWG